jgi:hypothetical protein
VTPLATLEQLSERTGHAFDPTDVRALTALEDASAFFRSYTGQVVSLVADDEQELRGNWTRRLWLPQRPVLGMTALSMRLPGALIFTAMGVASFVAERRGLVLWPGGYWGGPEATVKATYSHGYAEIPPDVLDTVCSMARRDILNPTGAATSETKTIGTFTHAVTYDAAAATRAGLTGKELKVLDKYRQAGMEGE